MIIFLFILELIFKLSHCEARPPKSDLEIRSDYRLSSESLTTEKVWNKDSRQKNAHLQRWVLSRHVEMADVRAVPQARGKFGVQVRGLLSSSEGFVRGQGPWFRPYSEFSCSGPRQPRFGNLEGAKRAVGVAAEIWVRVLEQEKVKLGLLLERVVSSSAGLALDQADQVFRSWLRDAELIWRFKAPGLAREEEWKFYLQEAQSLNFCEHKTPSLSVPSWKNMMEPVSDEPFLLTRLLARAPARLWDGFFTVRLNVTIANRTLNGRFMIDSGAPQSIVSPTWLENQGMLPAWTSIPGLMPGRVIWSDLWAGEQGLARRGYADSVELSGLVLPMNEFLIFETELFGLPENVGDCCDGILGSDFIKLFPMEFQSTSPAEVRVWPREGFKRPPGTPWIEISEGPQGDLLSSCTLLSAGKSNPSLDQTFSGVRWATGSDPLLQIHTPWQRTAKKVKLNSWSIQCDTVKIAQGVPAVFPTPPAGMQAKGPLSAEIPAAQLGMPFLTRGNFTFDLPHGRLWLEAKSLEPPYFEKNESGLILNYTFRKGERILRVIRILPRSPAQDLAKMGLRPQMQITQIDGIEVVDLDLWEVNRHLAGNFGSEVSLQWKTRKGLKMGPLRVKKSKP